MTWKEIKQAVDTAGVREDDDILFIECELHDGDKKLHPARSGNILRLRENVDETNVKENGCAI